MHFFIESSTREQPISYTPTRTDHAFQKQHVQHERFR